MGLNKVVEFSAAKLLKEKGFNEKCNSCFHKDFGDLINDSYPFLGTWSFFTGFTYDNSLDYIILAPTISEVVMWLYEKHGIWIIADPVLKFSCFIPRCFTKDNTSSGKYNGTIEFNSPTEAYEVAIEYTLNNLI